MHEAIHIEIRDGHLIFREGSPNGRVVREVATIRPSAQPVVKWAGGKQWLAEAAPILAPSEWIGRYYEPFMGGGAFFFGLKPARATLSDCNKELIVTHREIRDDPEGLIGVLRSYEYDHDFYYQLRSTIPRSPRRTAARMLYLNRSCGSYNINHSPLIDNKLKDDLHSFRGARNLVDHKVSGKRDDARRQRQFHERMTQGPRLVADLVSLRRKVK